MKVKQANKKYQSSPVFDSMERLKKYTVAIWGDFGICDRKYKKNLTNNKIRITRFGKNQELQV